jgi:WD40 repeat protein
VATASGDRTLRLWAIGDGSCLKTFEGHGASVLRVCFLSAGTQLMSSGADGLLKLWSVRTTECINTFDEHEDRVRPISPVLTLPPLQAQLDAYAKSGAMDDRKTRQQRFPNSSSHYGN